MNLLNIFSLIDVGAILLECPVRFQRQQEEFDSNRLPDTAQLVGVSAPVGTVLSFHSGPGSGFLRNSTREHTVAHSSSLAAG